MKFLKNTLTSLMKELKPLGSLYFKNMGREITCGTLRKKLERKIKMEVLIWENNLPENFILKNNCFNQQLVFRIFF